jgi:dephospho-CoA kinase
MIIVITGGIASGKSLVTELFAKLGFETIDIDKIGHMLLENNKFVRDAIIKAFPDAVSTDGSIDRSALSRIVFNDPKKLLLLNSIIHPILRLEYDKITEPYIGNDNHIIVEIPLIIESLVHDNYEYHNDYIILIQSSYEERLQRAMNRKGMTKEKFDAILQTQLPDSIKIKYSDFIIQNQDLESLSKAVNSIKDHIICQIS